jgi:hypothetical protein
VDELVNNIVLPIEISQISTAGKILRGSQVTGAISGLYIYSHLRINNCACDFPGFYIKYEWLSHNSKNDTTPSLTLTLFTNSLKKGGAEPSNEKPFKT